LGYSGRVYSNLLFFFITYARYWKGGGIVSFFS